MEAHFSWVVSFFFVKSREAKGNVDFTSSSTRSSYLLSKAFHAYLWLLYLFMLRNFCDDKFFPFKKICRERKTNTSWTCSASQLMAQYQDGHLCKVLHQNTPQNLFIRYNMIAIKLLAWVSQCSNATGKLKRAVQRERENSLFSTAANVNNGA